jgi:pyrroline-5-carboxylate reductase
MGARKSARKAAAKRIAFIGGGNMANALLRGLIATGRKPAAMTVAEPLAPKRTQLKRRYRVATTGSNTEAVASSDIVILAVKPQIIDEVLADIRPAVERRHLVISIAAGVKLGRIESALGGARVIRVMPNTPALVGRGASVMCAGTAARKADVADARAIFTAVGMVEVVDDEPLMDVVTALSGSGPAYVYRFAEALIEAGAQCGLAHALAGRLAYETIAGAAEMLIRTGESPRTLREAVSSPGGTTLAGLAALDDMGFYASVVAGVAAAKRRSEELGKS